MDLLLSSPASRLKGLELLVKSEKGEHLQMDHLELHKAESCHYSHQNLPLLAIETCPYRIALNKSVEEWRMNLQPKIIIWKCVEKLAQYRPFCFTEVG